MLHFATEEMEAAAVHRRKDKPGDEQMCVTQALQHVLGAAVRIGESTAEVIDLVKTKGGMEAYQRLLALLEELHLAKPPASIARRGPPGGASDLVMVPSMSEMTIGVSEVQ